MTRATALNRDEIARAALAQLDEDGVAGFSVRRLADRLDCGTMSLYRHFENRQELVSAVAELLLAEPLGRAGRHRDWDGRLRGVAREIRDVAVAHPDAVTLVISTMPRGFLRHRIAEVLDLDRDGIPTEGQRLLLATTLPFLLGWCLTESGPRARREQRGPGDTRLFADALDVIIDGLRTRLGAEVSSTPSTG